MQEFPINYAALLLATLAKMALGMTWYSPALFGTPWMNLVGRTPQGMKAVMPKAMLGDAIGMFIMAFVLVHAVHYAGARSAAQGAAVGFFNWLGFVAVTSFGSVQYEKRPFKLFLINNAFQLIGLLVMGAILAVWM